MATLADVEKFYAEQFQAFHRYLNDLHVAGHNLLAEAKQELRAQFAAGQQPVLAEQPHPVGGGLVADGPTPGVTEDDSAPGSSSGESSSGPVSSSGSDSSSSSKSSSSS